MRAHSASAGVLTSTSLAKDPIQAWEMKYEGTPTSVGSTNSVHSARRRVPLTSALFTQLPGLGGQEC